MQPAERTQSDGLQDVYSLEAGTTNTEPDLARQEFKDESDVNWILARFGVHAPSRIPVYGEIDFDTELGDVFEAAEQLRTTWQRLDPELRKRYRTWQELHAAMQRGELRLKRSVQDGEAIMEEETRAENPPEPPLTPPV